MEQSINEPNEVIAQIYFAVIPEWVLDLPISSAAVRIYCCLRRYADNTTGECFPSRRTLAKRSRISVATLDRGVKELATHGAIKVAKRKDAKGDWTSNLYTVMALPMGVASNIALPRARFKAINNPIDETIIKADMSGRHEHRLYPLGLDTQAPPAPPTKDEMEVIVKEFTELAKTGSKSHQQTMSRLARRFAKQAEGMSND